MKKETRCHLIDIMNVPSCTLYNPHHEAASHRVFALSMYAHVRLDPAPASWQPIRGNLASSELIAPIDGRRRAKAAAFDKICSLMGSMSPIPWNGC